MSALLLFPLLVAFGLFTGVAAGLLGVGGGIMMVPFLLFVAGLSQHEAEATSLLVVLPTAIVASAVLRRRGVGSLGTALRFGVVGSIGGAGGALLALALPGSTLRIVFAVFLALVGLRLVRDAARRPA
ncbi:MAG: TSUP family transporter [Gaiellaceae bacterium]